MGRDSHPQCSAAALTAARTVDDEQAPADFTGLWTTDYDSGARLEVEYVRGVPNGVYRYWHEDGVCIRDGFKKNGKWHGTLTTRGADGTVLDVAEFEDGTGIYRIFNSNHQLTDEVPLLRGKPHGVVRCWRFGELVYTKYYVDGQCNAALCEG